MSPEVIKALLIVIGAALWLFVAAWGLWEVL